MRTIVLRFASQTSLFSLALLLVLSVALAPIFLLTSRLQAQSEPLLSTSWQSAGGPFGGNVKVFSTGRDNIFAATSSGGVFRCSRFGSTWTAVNTGFQSLSIDAIYADPNSAAVYATTNAPVRFYVSTNNGDSWTQFGLVGNPPDGEPVTSIAVIGNAVVVTTSTGLFRSNDGGRSFRFNPVQGAASNITNAVTASGNVFFAGINSGLFRSVDFGETWSMVTTSLGDSIRFAALSLFTAGSNIIAGTDRGAYISYDAGATWRKFNSSTARINENSIALNTAFVVAKLNGSNVPVRTTLNGGDWQPTTFSTTNITRLDCIGGLGADFFTGGDFGIRRSGDAGNVWRANNSGVIAQSINTLFARGTRVFAGTSVGIFRSEDRGTTWQETTGFPSATITGFAELTTAPATPSAPLYFASADGQTSGILRSADLGVTWTFLPALQDQSTTTIATDGTSLYAGTYNRGLLRSDDAGTTWRSVSGVRLENQIRSLALMGNRLFAAHDLVDVGSEIVMSTNRGATWTTVGVVPTGSPNLTIPTIVVRGSVLYAVRKTTNPALAESAGVFRSLDSGATWSRMNAGITTSRVNSLLPAGQLLYAGTDDAGAFISYDSAKTWQPFNSGLPSGSVPVSFAVTDNEIPRNGTVLVGTASSGVFRIMTVSVRPATNLTTSGGKLFPNPASDVVSIEATFSPSKPATTMLLRLLTLAGATILERSERSQGAQFRTTLDISSLPRGTYIVELLDGERRLVEKIIKE